MLGLVFCHYAETEFAPRSLASTFGASSKQGRNTVAARVLQQFRVAISHQQCRYGAISSGY